MDETESLRQRGQARRLAQTLLVRPDDAACTNCLDLLEAYVDGQLAGADYAAAWPEIALHLDCCVACAEAYALVFEQRQAGAVWEIAKLPAPDLSFLRPDATAPLEPSELRALRRAERLRAALAGAVSQAGTTLRVIFSQALLDLLPAPGAPALAFRDAAQTPLFELALDASDGQIANLSVSAHIQEDDPKRCAVRVRVGLRGREWPNLSDALVTLVLGDERRHAHTDAWGEAVFGDLSTLALPQMQVAVEA